ncbi:hypothetical protein OEZ85_012139 [Tetradesmus obliquus]|uniref:2Fe-2S ferredoxin-type domain-containing protein n=1 Tax=Tetradesmus obliquus TaxID=3088 RepID=A0ABY8TUR9_TETOB|nr:hypothetical protein OEZ85_012139 [Tetradesmus obliquus]
MTVEFTLNGERIVVDRNEHLLLSAAEYIREHAHCKSVKVGCAEGGCGACAVEVLQQDATTGAQSVLALNSCLLPVAALHGAHVITAAGLGSSSSGFHELLRCLQDLAAAEEAAGRQLGARNVQFLAGHISRIAGTLVRNAATLGGHLALARCQQLESDLLPMLIAAGAEVQLAGTGGSMHWMPVEEFTLMPDSSSSVITAIRLPLPIGEGCSSAVWSYKLTTHRHHNEHAAVNLCCWLAGTQQQGFQLRVAVGTYQHSSSSSSSSSGSSNAAWRCSRAAAVEAALLAALAQQEQGGLLRVLGQLPELLLRDVTPAGRLEQYVRSAAPALLLKGLAVVLPEQLLLQQQQPGAAELPVTPAMLAELREAALAELAGRPLPVAQQQLPVDMDRAAPLYWPTEKEGALLQASGEALYTGDEPLAPNALYAACVSSKRAAGRLARVDWAPALAVEGVVGCVGPDDIPAGASTAAVSSFSGPQEPLFAWDEVDYRGQPLGLVLARSQRAAEAGAAAVEVHYQQQQQQQGEAGNGTCAKGSEGANGVQTNGSTVGDGADAGTCDDGPGLISLAAAVAAGSWYDVSKLPTKAARGDVDTALAGAARVLSGQLSLGSQRHLYMEPQTAVATPGEGGSMSVVSSCQGCDQVLWAVARLLQLQHNQVHVTCRRVGGGFGGKADRAIFPAAAAAVAARKFGRQVRLVVPGDVDGAMNAGRLPMLLFWEAGLDAAGSLAGLKLDITCTGGAFLGGGIVEVASIAYAADSAYDIPAFSVAVRVARCNLAPRTTVRGPGKLLLGKPIELCQYTLPYMWQQVAGLYRQRRPAVAAFNASSRLRKRGLAMVPIRYQLFHFARAARVQVYADGSVLVSHAGTEMGQGIATKVKQAAAAALGQLLPEPSQAAALLPFIRVAGGCTQLLPHAGVAASSTTSEGATLAVTLACQELVGRIRAQLEADAAAAASAGGGAQQQEQRPLTWEAAVKAVAPRDYLWAPKVVLSAAAVGSFGEGSGFGSGYHSFGAGLAEVELDTATGERQLRAVHLMFDAGRSINPAVDLGQVEGAFLQGVGWVLSEEVLEDPTNGACLTPSTWSYKPPGIAELPAEFSVAMLRDSPLHVPKLQQLGAKGTGEPPLMLAAAVACALQDAVAAAWADRGEERPEQLPVLHLPATTASIKQALPPFLG